MQGDELWTGRRPELLAQQHAQLVVGAQRLGDVPAREQRLDQRGASGLAERAPRHGRAAGALITGPGERLQRLHP